MTSALTSQLVVETLGTAQPHAVSSQLALETLGTAQPRATSSQVSVEVLRANVTSAVSGQLALEILRPYVIGITDLSTIVNDCDVLLQSGSRIAIGSGVPPRLDLTADAYLFKVTTGGIGSPSTINLKAILTNLSGTVTWSVTGATGLTTSGTTAVLAFANVTGSSVTVTAQVTYLGQNFTASLVISKATDGTNGSNGSNGTRGTVNIAVAGSWSDSAATSAIQSVTGTSPINRDVVSMYTGSSSTTKYYQSGSWLTMDAYIGGNLLVTGTVSCAVLAADTMVGQTYKTATSGQRVTINEGSNNAITFYDAGGTQRALMGGSGAGVVYGSAVNTVPGVFGSGGSAPGVYAFASSGTALLVSGTATMDSVNSGTHLPDANNAYNLGSAGSAWAGIYSVTALNVTSDARAKTDVAPSDLGLDFVLRLRPVSYRLKVGENTEVLDPEAVGPWAPGAEPWVAQPRPGARRHYGLLAQEVKVALGTRDAAFWCLADPADPDSAQSLRYEELVPVLIQAVQELTARVRALEGKA
jgi:hypothetical protein